ncbi:hypothetical protein IAT38_003218 [Cryptococcus sp. DSM 104549]
MTKSEDTINIIVNPAAGHGQGPQFVDTHVLPLIKHFSRPYQIHRTTAPLHAGEIGREIRAGAKEGERLVVVVVGGDGTAHELIEGVLEGKTGTGGGEKKDGVGRWELVILPFGTANALYASLYPPESSPPDLTSLLSALPEGASPPEDALPKLYPLLALLEDRPPIALPITLTSFLSSPTSTPAHTKAEVIPSHVVLSTSLHAAILDSSEALRAAHPGPERFRMAAQQNAGLWWDATARLFPVTSAGTSGEGRVEQWNPRKGEWVEVYTAGPQSEGADGGVNLPGPFSYFLSTSTVDRLEPTFVISPQTSLRSNPASSAAYIHIVLLRPLRDPRVRAAPEGERAGKWTERAFEVLGKAYAAGAHVDLTYPSTGAAQGEAEGQGAAETKGLGEVVVEYFRCGSFEWEPVSSSEQPPKEGRGDATLVCADGALHHIPAGGRAKVELLPPGAEGFYLYA